MTSPKDNPLDQPPVSSGAQDAGQSDAQNSVSTTPEFGSPPPGTVAIGTPVEAGATNGAQRCGSAHAASFRDPSGFLFTRQDLLYRQVNHSYAAHYDRLMTSGLYQALVDARLLVPHQEVDVEPEMPALAYKVLRPELVVFISYPYEWGFSQLKDAALTTLKIQKLALEKGQTLKDASAYNIQFLRGRPTLIDTLSFEAYQEGQPWVAYRQFCQHFLAPLSLMALRDVRLSQLLRLYIDGVPLDLAAELLPARTRLNLNLALHIHAHAASQKKYAGGDDKITGAGKVSRTAFLGLIDSLESAVKGLSWKPAGTEWGDYYQDTNYTAAGQEHKLRLVSEFLEIANPHTVWDLGANTALFSRQASARGAHTVAFDIDPAAVERAYLAVREKKEKNLLPLLLDLTNPSPSLGWHNRERMSLLERGPVDCVMALALVHHLAISNNVPLDRLAAFFADCGRWLIIEFVPKPDSQVQRLLSTRLDIFDQYDEPGFERAFAGYFTIHRSEPIKDSQRRLYLMEKRAP